MAHKEQRDFCFKVKNKYPEFFENKKVLDIGSLDINGSNNSLFENCNYLGIDVADGKNVDFVSVGHLFKAPNNYFDVIISTEVFEHDMFYQDTIKNIMRMLKPGGLFIFTCAAPGRPEHGTRRCGENCAPLLIQISEQWADYYKNLTESDIREISGFNECFPDGYFELNEVNLEIPSDLYFYGIKGGAKFYTKNIIPQFDQDDFYNHIFVIDAWPDTESKENDLVNLIKILKGYNIPILLCGHYPIKEEIQGMVDYFLFDKNNPLLLQTEFDSHAVASGRWTANDNYRVENSLDFHHDYAIWTTMQNAFKFCKNLGKEFIHFLEYDNRPDFLQYRQAFIERIPNFDAIIYEYQAKSSVDTHFSPYCATYIFSIRTDVAIQVVNQINSKFDYFTDKPQGWQLERVFLSCLRNVTDRILISDYIDNNSDFNTQAVWNRDGISRNGARFQPYLAVANNRLYLHLISGFHQFEADKDYLIELNYANLNKFLTLRKGEYLLEDIGPYRKGDTVKLFYQGVNVFDEFLGEDVNIFALKNKVMLYNNSEISKTELIPNPIITYNFTDGPFVEITDKDDANNYFEYNLEFIDNEYNKTFYSTNIKSNHWAKPSIKYLIKWKIKITGINSNFYGEINFEPKNKRFLISFESSSLGDNLAWISSVEEFRIKNDCHVICSTFFNDLFSSQYPNIEFVSPGTTVHNLYGLYRIGLFLNDENKLDLNKHPSNPLQVPLMKISSDILGLTYKEIRPILPRFSTNKVKRVCIAIHSTSQCKYWNNPDGWQHVVNFLKSKGYEVRLLSREEDGYMGNKNPKGVIQQRPSHLKKIAEIIQESELFIGISSGLSWLSWALGTPTILISGFTDKYLEPEYGVKRIINESVCHGCWHEHEFDRKDWNWCPKHKGTNRQFECTKEITSEDVIKAIEEFIN